MIDATPRARVLIVEDDAALAEMFALLPRRSGHEVLIARDGDQALALAFSEQPDLILLDVRMPRQSGLEVLEQLRGLGYTGTAWILSSYSQRQMIARGLAAGATRWLVKSSVTPRELTVLINEWTAANLIRARSADRPADSRNRTGIPILVADNSATYVAVNSAAAALLEATLSEVIGRKVWDFTPHPHVPLAEELWQRFVRRGSDSGPFLVVTSKGREIRVHYEAFANVSTGLHVSVLEPEGARTDV